MVRKDAFGFAVEDNDRIVGCIGAIPSTKYTEDYVELVRMFVSADCRKINIGSRLIVTLERWAHHDAGYLHINLSTLSHLIESNKFYPKNGFVLKESEEFDVCAMVGVSSPAIVVANHYVKTIMVLEIVIDWPKDDANAMKVVDRSIRVDSICWFDDMLWDLIIEHRASLFSLSLYRSSL
jgi:hypothetical protein